MADQLGIGAHGSGHDHGGHVNCGPDQPGNARQPPDQLYGHSLVPDSHHEHDAIAWLTLLAALGLIVA